MKTIISLSSVAFVLVSLVLGGCAAAEGEDDTTPETTSGSESSTEVAVDVADQGITPNRLGAGKSGYQPRVKYADLRAAGASCRGAQCTLNGQDWDCSGGGYCSNVSQ